MRAIKRVIEPAPGASGQYADATAAHDRGDYATALRLWHLLADQGDADAQNNLGHVYRFGEGVPRDYAKAARWFRKAAEQGSVRAQFRVGSMYHNGSGVPQDETEALKWWRKCAEQGHAGAQGLLGVIYGSGARQDDAESAKWWRMAAEQGHFSAQYEIGVMLENARGVPQDCVQAHMWFDIAARRGHERATKARDIIADRMTPAQIAEAQLLARERWARLPPDYDPMGEGALLRNAGERMAAWSVTPQVKDDGLTELRAAWRNATFNVQRQFVDELQRDGHLDALEPQEVVR